MAGKKRDISRDQKIQKPQANTRGEPLNHEHSELADWFRTVKFKKTCFGGVNETQLWKKLQELQEIYDAALRAERARYDTLLDVYKKTAAASIAEARRALEKKELECQTLKQRLLQTEGSGRGRFGA